MKRTTIIAALGSVLLMLPLGAEAGGKGHHRHDEFSAKLSGANEVPPVATETSGRFRLAFSAEMGKAEFRLKVNDGTRVTQAHIHCAPAGVNGPIIIFLGGFHANGWDVDGWWVANATVTDANIVNTACGTTLADIAASMRAGMTYVNVHTVANPGGEVRGQIGGDD